MEIKKKKRTKNNKSQLLLHRILREVYRHYIDFEDYYMREGSFTFEMHHLPKCDWWLRHERDKAGKPTHAHKNAECNCGLSEFGSITISFIDLKNTLGILSKRKQEAFRLNVIEDRKQEEVAEIMGVTTVTVGQYVEMSCVQLSKHYFSELYYK